MAVGEDEAVGSDDEARAAALAALAVLHRNMDDGRPGLVDRADHRRGISVEYFAISRRVGDFRQGLALFIQIEHESSPPRHMGRGKVGYQRGSLPSPRKRSAAGRGKGPDAKRREG